MKIFSLKKLIAVLVAVCGTYVFAQSVSSPSISSITAPSMPTIEAPTIGTSYYWPGNSSKKTNTTSTEEKSADEKSSEAKKAAAELQSVQSVLSTLTANELQTLNVNGVLENVLEKNSLSKTSSSETDDLLKQVLSEMEEIKKISAQSSSQPVETQSVSSTTSAATTQGSGSRLLRFKVNGYDILRTCRTVFISDVQDDGSFLVTGDRRYQSDGSTRTETFHLLFKSDSGANGIKNYNAAAAVTQDYLNENSFLYQMSQREDLQAVRTGNLITMRTTDPVWKLEMLIDLGTSSK